MNAVLKLFIVGSVDLSTNTLITESGVSIPTDGIFNNVNVYLINLTSDKGYPEIALFGEEQHIVESACHLILGKSIDDTTPEVLDASGFNDVIKAIEKPAQIDFEYISQLG